MVDRSRESDGLNGFAPKVALSESGNLGLNDAIPSGLANGDPCHPGKSAPGDGPGSSDDKSPVPIPLAACAAAQWTLNNQKMRQWSSRTPFKIAIA
jgi:hypothetical protein